jgi:hypothetical protein
MTKKSSLHTKIVLAHARAGQTMKAKSDSKVLSQLSD